MEGNKLRLMMVSMGSTPSGSAATERTTLMVDAPAEDALPLPLDADPEDEFAQHPACRGRRGTILKGGEGPLEVSLPDKDKTLQQVDNALGRMQKISPGTTGGGSNQSGS